ncbi:MAG: response regulator transcription factor [Succinatimonas sp.]|nr:response regulator transcription factor [Succinatimonas sp.]MDY5722933.1 response regulator transcription factor [Succinivibrio sp.]
MRILVVEDDTLISKAIENGLKSQAYAVDCIMDGNEALYAPKDISYDCILLDLGLPGIDGVKLLSTWRKEGINTPIIIITARDGLDDRVQGLDIGADDYVVKPFDLTELIARIRAVTRRSSKSNDVVSLSNGVLSLDPLTHEVKVKNEDETTSTELLTSREYALLEALLRHPGAVLSRETLEDKIYSFGEEVESNAIEFIIHNLRKKVGASNIKNVRGVGWKVVKGN